jgi:hypothetical protein
MKIVDKIEDIDVLPNLNWYNVISYQELSDSFIDKYVDHMPIDYLVKYQKLSESFILRHVGCGYRKFSLYDIITYQKVSKYLIKYIADYFKYNNMNIQ